MNGAPAKPSNAARSPSACLRQAQCFHDVRRRLPCRNEGEAIDVGSGPDRRGDDRANAGANLERHADAGQRQHDVREEHRRIDAKAVDRHQRGLGGKLRRRRHGHEIVAFPQRAVFWQRAARLAHEPDRRRVHRLSSGPRPESAAGPSSGSFPATTSVPRWMRSRLRPTRLRGSTREPAAFHSPSWRHR